MPKRTDVKNGSEMSLLAAYGIVDVTQTIEWIKSNTGVAIVDVKLVNDASKAGRIYFDECGRPLQGTGESYEKKAKYMVLPIGYTQTKTGHPLVASFMRGSFAWEGAKINTIIPIIDGFIKHAPMSAIIDRESIIKPFDGYFEVVGDGYAEVLKHNEELRKNMSCGAWSESSTLGSLISADMKNKLEKFKGSVSTGGEVDLKKGTETEEVGVDKPIEEQAKADAGEPIETEEVSVEKPKRVKKASSTTTTTKKATATKKSTSKKKVEELAVEVEEAEQVKEEPAQAKEEPKEQAKCVIEYEVSNYPIFEQILDKTSPFTDVAKEAYGKLLDKSGWKMGDTDCFTPHIHYIFEAINNEISTGTGFAGNGYILSSDRGKCVVNTGLVNKFGYDIFILDYNAGASTSTPRRLEVVNDWTGLTKEGFSKEVIKTPPSPIKFYNDPSELVFTKHIDDFDFSSSARLAHIIDERRFRFPSRYSTTPADVLASMIISSVVDAIKMSERDFKYIVPIYNFRLHKIQYMAPVYLSNSRKDKPVLAAVIGEINGFYSVFTVLTINKAYANARLLSRQDPSWLKISG